MMKDKTKKKSKIGGFGLGIRARLKEGFSANGKLDIQYPSKFKELINKTTQLKKEKNEASDKVETSMQNNFELVMTQWGVTEDNINTVKWGLLIETVSWTVIASALVLSFILTTNSFIMLLTCFTIAPFFYTCAVMKYWRYLCIKNRKFKPFKKWIYGH